MLISAIQEEYRLHAGLHRLPHVNFLYIFNTGCDGIVINITNYPIFLFLVMLWSF